MDAHLIAWTECNRKCNKVGYKLAKHRRVVLYILNHGSQIKKFFQPRVLSSLGNKMQKEKRLGIIKYFLRIKVLFERKDVLQTVSSTHKVAKTTDAEIV